MATKVWREIASAEVEIVNYEINEKKIYFMWSDYIAELHSSSTLLEMHFCAKRKGQILILLESPLKNK